MSRRHRGARRAGLLLLGCLSLAGPGAAQTFDPAYRFRTWPTAHFVIHFHQGEDRLASRLAAIAEETWQALRTPLGATPPTRTEVVLVDQQDLYNGYATPVPRDTIVIFATWPAGSDYVKTDDWLRIVFTHEFTHVVHLDRSAGWARAVRTVFGRAPIAFPNLFLPAWQIEGLATYEESLITGEGRLHAGDFRAIVDEAARAGRLEPLDRVNGGLTDWPNGNAQYAYGLGFHAFLADRYGADKIGTLADATSRRLPWLGSRAFKGVYLKSLGALWLEYQTSLTARPAPAATDDGARRMTHHGFVVSGPRFAPPTCPTCATEVLYSVRNADERPALYSLRLDGSPADTTPARVTTRLFGSTTAPGRQTVYFDQIELRREAGLYSDLYALDRASGRVHRITSDVRLEDPDLSPDGRSLVAVENRIGQRDLVLIQLASGRGALDPVDPRDIATLVTDAETQFNAPRWSPDGRTIAVERQRAGGFPEIVIIDTTTRAVKVVASDPGVRWVTPAWRPDGLAVIAAADLNDGPFNLFEIDLGLGRARQITHSTGSATWPGISPDGKTLVFVGYGADGSDLFRMPYVAAPAPGEFTRVEPAATAAPNARPASPAAAAAPLPARPYSPWRTFAPTCWSPVVEYPSRQVRLGAAVAGSDVLNYHAYVASANWGVVRPAGAVAPRASTPDWNVTYLYTRWRPRVWISALRETSFFAGPPTDAGLASAVTLRARKIEAGVQAPITHVRTSQFTVASFLRESDEFTFADGIANRRRAAARAGWGLVTAHRDGYSISLERGLAAGVTAELVRRSLGSSADATTFSGDLRAYVPGLTRHQALAMRLSGGATTGDRGLGRTFLLGGSDPTPGLVDFGSDAMSLLRGFQADTFAGTHVGLINVEYRLPLARPQRGLGTWPFFLHTIHAAVFIDVGHAWTTAFAARDAKTSFGAELSEDLVLGYQWPITVTFGLARGHDGSHAVADQTTIYVRVGRVF